MTEPTSVPPAARPSRGPRPSPLDLVPVVLAAAGAVLLLGGVLFALASADANAAGPDDRFRLLGQAANPFIAGLALAASALVGYARRAGREPVGGPAALGIAAVVSSGVALLALNGVLTDLIGDASALFKTSAVVNRSAAVLLSSMGLWLSVSAPPRPPAP